MTYSRPALETLKARASADILSELPYSDNPLRNSLLDALAENEAYTAHGLYGALDFLSRQLFPDTAEGEFLDRQLNWRGIYRIAPKPSHGTITMTGTDGTTIPKGTTLSGGGVHFTTDAGVVVSGGTATLALTSQESGEQTNLPSGTRLELAVPILGVDADAFLSHPTTGGSDIEDDDSYRARGLALIAGGGFRYGKSGDFASWVLDASPHITRAVELANVGNLGRLEIVCFAEDSQALEVPASSGDITQAETYLKRVAPLGIIWDVRAPTTSEMGVI